MKTTTYFASMKGIRYSTIVTVEGDNWRGVIFMADKHLVDYCSGVGSHELLDPSKLARRMWSKYKEWKR